MTRQLHAQAVQSVAELARFPVRAGERTGGERTNQKQKDAASSGEWAPSCDGRSTTPCCDGWGDRCSQISPSLAPVPLPGDVAPPIPRAVSGVSNHYTRGAGRALADHSLLPGLAEEGGVKCIRNIRVPYTPYHGTNGIAPDLCVEGLRFESPIQYIYT